MAVSEHAVYYLEIVTTDVRATADFYANAYGWRFEAEAPELGNAMLPSSGSSANALPIGSRKLTKSTAVFLRFIDENGVSIL